jgi:hypothetical protein
MMHATQIKHKELVEVLVVVLRGFAPRIIWKQVGMVDGFGRGQGHSTPAESCEEFGGSADRRRRR